MLSLNQSIQKINEEEAARLAAARELSAAADAAAEYAVEVDPRETGQFREHLRNLSEQLSRQPSHDSLQSARHNFQTELRQYSAHASKEVRRLKQDLHAAAQAMQSFAQGISTGAHEHEALLRQEFEQLTRASDQDDLPALRATVRQTVAAVTASYQELRQAHNLVIAQLRDEIRTLQQTVERQSNSATPAPPTLLERRVLDQHLEEKLRARQGFHLLLARPCHPDHPKVPDEVTIAQLQDEIRSLHREVEHERRAALEDPVTHLWNRAKLDARIQDLVLLNETFCVFTLGIRNLSQLAASDARLHSETLRAFGRRLQNCVKTSGEIGMPGRWSEDCFAIVFNLPLSGVPVAAEQLQSTLGGNYSIQLDGESHIVSLDLRVQAVERPKGGNEGAFFLSLGQAAFSITAH
ncbi:MAG: Diguanylate cyclase, domain [Acidobacteriota bacterium]